MDLLIDNPWRKMILTPIQTEVDLEDEPSWIELDGDMVKLGSLEHESLNIVQTQQKALILLSTKSKDVRVIAHLLKTLQHSGKTTELLLGLALLSDYAEVYWEKAPPLQNLKKKRLGQQILKRFENMATKFNQSASRLEKEEAKVQLERLKCCWDDSSLLDSVETLLKRYTFSEPVEIESSDELIEKDESPSISNNNEPTTGIAAVAVSKSMIVEPIEIEHSNEKAWRNTLLKVADYLIDKDLSEPVGYQLRRYAIWNNITAAPMAENNKTQLAAISIDRVAEYKAELENANVKLWREVEYSLTLAPFWFEGHYLSAEIANRLGYIKVANAIKGSLEQFLERLPLLKALTFNDSSPFLPQSCEQWLQQGNPALTRMQDVDNNHYDIDAYYEAEGLEKALARINEQTHLDMRDKVYAQLQSIRLLDKSGLSSLAKQHYVTLLGALDKMLVKDWEPSLFTLLTQERE
ncbi:type VI secretion system protein TssA [Pasteurella sp. PK-2025]|uniref:type VI secretion system protein TssA n=1 Tax=Pasteurella sp. PK-2025 TaxID=3413133 RepID=UPI003C787A75